MQPIILLAIAGVVATTLSMGSLMPAITNLNLQGVSINERDFSAPLTTANVGIDVAVTTANSGETSILVNLIDRCTFHVPFTGEDRMGQGSKVICKLSDHNGMIVAEGSRDGPFSPSTNYDIMIDTVATTFANEIQNIDDVKIIILGTNPGEDSSFDDNQPLPDGETHP